MEGNIKTELLKVTVFVYNLDGMKANLVVYGGGINFIIEGEGEYYFFVLNVRPCPCTSVQCSKNMSVLLTVVVMANNEK